MKDVYLICPEADFPCDVRRSGRLSGMIFDGAPVYTETAEGKKITLIKVKQNSVCMGDGEVNKLVYNPKDKKLVIGAFAPVRIKTGYNEIKEVYIITLTRKE